MSIDLTFRRMQPSDKEALTAICMKIWGEGDFLIREFDKFVEDTKGEFTAVEHDGKLVAAAKFTYITDTDGWLQGLRKDLDFEMHGVGHAITQHYIDLAKQNENLTSLRFTTYMKNYHSRTLNEKLGFRVALTLSMKNSFVSPFTPARDNTGVTVIDDEKKVLDFIHNSPFFKLTKNNVNLGWIVHPYRDEFIIEQFIKSGECFCIYENSEIKALALTYIDNKRLVLSFFDAVSFEHASRLMYHVYSHARKNEKDTVMIFRPDYDKLKKWFVRMFFKSWECENDFLMYEYPLSKLREN